jgi:hypothetical protein
VRFACLEAERALQAVHGRLDDLMEATTESGTGTQAARAFMAGRREALTAMDDLRLVIVREVWRLMLTTDRQCRTESVAPATGHQDGYAEIAEQLRALAAGLSAIVEAYETSPRSLDNVITADGGVARHAETVIMNVYELMKRL